MIERPYLSSRSVAKPENRGALGAQSLSIESEALRGDGAEQLLGRDAVSCGMFISP